MSKEDDEKFFAIGQHLLQTVMQGICTETDEPHAWGTTWDERGLEITCKGCKMSSGWLRRS